jgi:hypothetical protein
MGLWSTEAKEWGIVLRAAWHWGGDSSVINDPFRDQAYQRFPPIWGSAGGDFCSSVLMEEKWDTRMKEKWQKPYKGFLWHRVSIWKLILPSQQGDSSSGIPPWGTDSISQPEETEKTTWGRSSPVVRNLSLLSIAVTFLGASSSGIPPQGASSSSKPVGLTGSQ